MALSARWVPGLVLATVMGSAAPAQALEIWPFRGHVQQLVDDAESARQRGQLDLARSLLDEAAESQADHPGLLLARGYLLRDRGKLVEAAEAFDAAARRDPTSPARLEQAAVLVTQGKWPESVEVLRRAFDERSASLRVDVLLRDPRFAPLSDFAPFIELTKTVREQQAGPLGRLLLKIESLEDTVRVIQALVVDVTRLADFTSRVARTRGVLVGVFLFMTLLLTFGYAQFGVVGAPWTLVLGTTTASVAWALLAGAVSGGTTFGFNTIIPATLGVIGCWGAVVLAHRALAPWRKPPPYDPKKAAPLMAEFLEAMRGWEEGPAPLKLDELRAKLLRVLDRR